MQDLYAWDFQKQNSPRGVEANQVVADIDQVDEWVHQAAPNRPIEQINKLDLAILRLAAYELMIDRKAPFKVVIDEAVELAKEFGSENSPSFVNGALGNLLALQTPPNVAKIETTEGESDVRSKKDR